MGDWNGLWNQFVLQAGQFITYVTWAGLGCIALGVLCRERRQAKRL